MHDNAKCIFHKIMSAEFPPLNIICEHKVSMSFNKPTDCGNIPNIIQIDT